MRYSLCNLFAFIAACAFFLLFCKESLFKWTSSRFDRGFWVAHLLSYLFWLPPVSVENINADIPLAKACVNDADKFCQKLEAGVTVLACLRERKEELSSECKSEVFERQTEASKDWRTDSELYKACEVKLESVTHSILFSCFALGC